MRKNWEELNVKRGKRVESNVKERSGEPEEMGLNVEGKGSGRVGC